MSLVDTHPIVFDYLALVLLFLGFLPTLYLIGAHLCSYTFPILQRYFVRLLFFINIFCFFTFSMLIFYKWFPYIALVRDLYEAYSVFVFFWMMVSYCGDIQCLKTCVRNKIETNVKVIFCLHWRNPTPEKLVNTLNITVSQYMVTKPLLGTIMIILSMNGFKTAAIVVRILCTCCLIVAMWSLLVFYRACKNCLVGLSLAKVLLWFKGLIFLNLVQELLKNQLVSFGVIKNSEYFTAAIRAERMFSILCLFEAVIFAFLAFFVFPPSQFAKDSTKNPKVFFNQNESEEENTLRLSDNSEQQYGKGSLLGAKSVSFFRGLFDAIQFWKIRGTQCPHGVLLENITYLPDIDEPASFGSESEKSRSEDAEYAVAEKSSESEID